MNTFKTIITCIIILLNIPLFLIGFLIGIVASCFGGLVFGLKEGWVAFDNFMNENMPPL